MSTRALSQRTHHKPFHRHSIVSGEDPGPAFLRLTKERIASQFLPPGGEPFIANIQTNNQPEPGHTGVGKEQPGNRRFWNLSCNSWLYLKRTHCFAPLRIVSCEGLSLHLRYYCFIRTAFLLIIGEI